MRAIFISFFLLGVAGCANLDYINDQYGTVPMVIYEHGDHPYRVFDRPAESRALISASLGAAMGNGFIRGATFGILNNNTSEPLMRDALSSFLTNTGRACKIHPGHLIAEPEWEFWYECSAVASAR